jgi:hypothetical protein
LSGFAFSALDFATFFTTGLSAATDWPASASATFHGIAAQHKTAADAMRRKPRMPTPEAACIGKDLCHSHTTLQKQTKRGAKPQLSSRRGAEKAFV